MRAPSRTQARRTAGLQRRRLSEKHSRPRAPRESPSRRLRLPKPNARRRRRARPPARTQARLRDRCRDRRPSRMPPCRRVSSVKFKVQSSKFKAEGRSFVTLNSLLNPRRAAFEEGADALAGLARLEALELRLGLVLEHPLQALVLAHVNGALGRGD